jgi:hypothetical protein
MPAANCDDTHPYAFTVNGECDFNIGWTWDGASTPPNCQGTVQSITWENRSATTTYNAHVAGTSIGSICVIIPPAGQAGSSGTEANKTRLRQAGLQTIADIRGDLSVSTVPPQPGETIIQAASL